jgi:hypothetical protein
MWQKDVRIISSKAACSFTTWSGVVAGGFSKGVGIPQAELKNKRDESKANYDKGGSSGQRGGCASLSWASCRQAVSRRRHDLLRWSVCEVRCAAPLEIVRHTVHLALVECSKLWRHPRQPASMSAGQTGTEPASDRALNVPSYLVAFCKRVSLRRSGAASWGSSSSSDSDCACQFS